MPENLLTGPLALTAFRKEKITILIIEEHLTS